MVAALKWDKFYTPSVMSNSDIVREFYSNIWVTQSADVHVCGRVVLLTALAINGFFSLPDYHEDGYSSMLLEATNATYAQVLRIVVVEGTEWIRSSRRGAWSCKRLNLTNEAKLWFNFLLHTTMPTGHVFTIN